MPHTNHRTIDELRPGDAFALYRETYPLHIPTVHVLALTHADGDTWNAVEEGGRLWSIERIRDRRHPGASPTWTILREREGERRAPPLMDAFGLHLDAWTDPLPRGTAGQGAAFVAAMLGERRQPMLLWVGKPGASGTPARIVTMADGDDPGLVHRMHDMDRADAAGPATWARSAHGAAWIWDPEVTLRPSENLAEGDLVVGPISCEIVDGDVVTRVEEPVVLGNFPDAGAVGAFVPDVASTGHSAWWGPLGPEHHEQEAALAQARTEPDEALVLTVHGCADPHVLATTGASFFWSDDTAATLSGESLEPGLWVMENAKWWTDTSYEGEHDSGIDGDWRPATPADLERFGIDAHEIADAIEVDPAEVDVNALCDAAERACEASRATASSRSP